jgi:nucleotide-binding universal stress UspA family protein
VGSPDCSGSRDPIGPRLAATSDFGSTTYEKKETDAANRRLREQEEQQLRAAVQEVVPSFSLPLEILEDEPYAALRNRIATFGADLLAMGTHARSRLSTAIVGSLAQEFLAAGPCDVLVARGY